MKKLIIATAIAIASLPAAANESEWTIKSKDGDHIRVMPSTVRVYENEHGATQADALIEVNKRGAVTRHRWGVTGCMSGFGLASVVTQIGGSAAGATVYEWALEGDRMFDGMSALVCAAALQQEKRVRAKKGPSV